MNTSYAPQGFSVDGGGRLFSGVAGGALPPVKLENPVVLPEASAEDRGIDASNLFGIDQYRRGSAGPILTQVQLDEVHRRIEAIPEEELGEMIRRLLEKRAEFKNPKDEFYFWFYCIAGQIRLVDLTKE